MVWFVMGGWVGWFDRWVAGGLVGWVDGVLLEAFLDTETACFQVVWRR